jgi:hypothetical protein
MRVRGVLLWPYQESLVSDVEVLHCHVLAYRRREMLLKAVGHRWALQKGHRKAAGKYPKAIGKPLDNS